MSTTPLTDSLPNPIWLRVSVPGGLPLVGSGPNSPNGHTLMCSAESVQDVYSGSPLASGDPDSLGGHAPVCSAVNVRGVECNVDGLLLTSSGPDSLGSCVPMRSAMGVQDMGHNVGGLPVCSAASTQEAGSIVWVVEPTARAKLTIRIPASLTNRETGPVTEDELDEDTTTG